MDKLAKVRAEVARIQLYTQSEVLKQVLDYIDMVQKEPVSEKLEEIAWNYADKRCHLDVAVFTPDEVKKERGKMQFTWQDLYDAVMFGAKWQKQQDQSTIELAEDHAYFAGKTKTIDEIKEALLSEVLPCFMHGGEADEVVAKLDEVLNQKK